MCACVYVCADACVYICVHMWVYYVCMCICVHICVHVCLHVCVCKSSNMCKCMSTLHVYGSQRTTILVVVLLFLMHLVSWSRSNLPITVNWPAHQPQRAACLQLCSTKIRAVSHRDRLFYMGSVVLTQLFKHFTSWAISPQGDVFWGSHGCYYYRTTRRDLCPWGM